MIVLPILLIGGGLAAVASAISIALSGGKTDYEPDISPPPPHGSGLTGYSFVNKLLSEPNGGLRAAAASSGIPLGLLVGWVAAESGGLLEEWGAKRSKPTTSVWAEGERGYFQLSPPESKALGLDHRRLSQDPAYSIDAGIRRIKQIMATVDGYGIAPRGSSFFWRLVKLVHTIGGGSVKKLVDGAKARGGDAARSWEGFEDYALGSGVRLASKKWFGLVDKVYRVGAPFGFGDGATTVVGGAFDDIPDPLDCVRGW